MHSIVAFILKWFEEFTYRYIYQLGVINSVIIQAPAMERVADDDKFFEEQGEQLEHAIQDQCSFAFSDLAAFHALFNGLRSLAMR